MSDTEQSSDTAILKKLQDVVISLHKSGNTADLTVKRVRTRAEEALGLPAGLLKGAEWKQKSQDAIMEAVDKYCGDEPEPEPEPVKPAPKASKPKAPAKKAGLKAESKQGAKRKAAAPKKQPQKRRKTASSEDELSDELSDEESEPTKPARRAKNVVEEDSDEDDAPPTKPTKKAKPIVDDEEDDSDAGPATTSAKKAKTPPPRAGNDSESELSSLLDESPAKNKRQKKASAAKGKKEPVKPKAKAASKAADDPDQAEIKQLQSWLVKCGIRKVWSKELAKFDTSKKKIKHLKEMLSDAGMDGRFSDEKAAKIKEKREFAKDLEAIQEGEAAWGTTEDTGGRPRRRAAARPAPVQKIEFSDDDEESEDHNDNGDESSDDDQDDEEEENGKSDSNSDGGGESAADDSD